MWTLVPFFQNISGHELWTPDNNETKTKKSFLDFEGLQNLINKKGKTAFDASLIMFIQQIRY